MYVEFMKSIPKGALKYDNLMKEVKMLVSGKLLLLRE